MQVKQKKEVYVKAIMDIKNVLYRMTGSQMDIYHREIENIVNEVVFTEWKLINDK